MINIESVRQLREDKINKKIAELNDPNIQPEIKRLIVLNEMNASDNCSLEYNCFYETPLFDINKVREKREKKIEERIKKIKNELLTKEEKRLIVLDEMNTSLSSNSEEEIENKGQKEIINQENDISDMFNKSFSEQSTGQSSLIYAKPDNEMVKYWIKYNLYDAEKSNQFVIPNQEKIEKDKICYFYDNKLVTYAYIQSVIFGEKYSINEDISKDENYNESLGLYFCGNKIELGQKEVKKCCPNEMMCKECMNKNKRKYNLKNKYAININGRAAKKNKGGFHCFGHFKIGKLIENCVDKFSCEACLILNKYEHYYFSEE